jgi:5-formyltetrahydrofolate cyclo-ligase
VRLPYVEDVEPAVKQQLRRYVLKRRRDIPAPEQEARAAQLCERVLALRELHSSSVVAAYRSLPGEPGTGPLLAALTGMSVTVLLPVRQPDDSLRWRTLEPSAATSGSSGSADLEPANRLFRAVDLIVCPGVAGDRDGHRLGRGGGSYDRTLAVLPSTVLRVLLLHDDEVFDAVPVERHDQTVDVLVTPTRTLRVQN